MVGFTSPAQASQAAAGISDIAAWTRIVTLPALSFIACLAPGSERVQSNPFIHFCCSISARRSARAKIGFAPPLSSLPRNRLIDCLTVDGRLRTKMRVLRCTLIAFLLAVLAAPALAETLGDARVGFSAERVLVINGQSYVGRMWHMPGEQRHEQDLPALRPIFILRAGTTIGDIILPKLHTVVEFALPKELSILGDPKLLRKPVGQETVNGIATTKYEVDEEKPQGRAVGSLWLSEEGIPMKCDARLITDKGKVSTIRWELRHVKIGAQDAALFEIPHDYAKLPPEAAAPLLGMRLARPPAR
jgi:hypothetical protein